jgi:hypothetical protein
MFLQSISMVYECFWDLTSSCEALLGSLSTCPLRSYCLAFDSVKIAEELNMYWFRFKVFGRVLTHDAEGCGHVWCSLLPLRHLASIMFRCHVPLQSLEMLLESASLCTYVFFVILLILGLKWECSSKLQIQSFTSSLLGVLSLTR